METKMEMLGDICNACGSKDHRRYLKFESKNVEIAICKGCGLFRTFPYPETDYGEQEFYCEHYLRNENLYRGFARDIVKIVKQYKQNGKLLDIGCAVGFVLEESRKNGFNAEGVELNKKAREISRSKGFRVESRELKESGHEENSFDIVTLNHILEHIVEPNIFLQGIKKILKKDAILVVGVPNHDSLIAKLYRTRWYGWGIPEHIWHFDRNSLAGLLSKNGFKIEKLMQNSQHYSVSKSLRKNTMAITANIGNVIGSGDQLIAVTGVKL